jgi:adenylate cyclase
MERALDLDPSSAVAAWALGTLLGWTERWEEGAALFQRALRLSPRDPHLHHFEGALGALHLRAGRYEEALAHARRSVEVEPEIGISHRPLVAAALALLGRLDEARAEFEPILRERPDFNLALAGLVAPPAFIERLREGLTLAGFFPRNEATR